MISFQRFILLILILLCAYPLLAQEEKEDSTALEKKNVMTTLTDGITTSVRYTGETIQKVGKHINAIDTNYISPNLYNLAFMLEHSTWYEHYKLGTDKNGYPQRLSFSPNLGTKLGIYFGWRWIFLGYTFDIEDLFGGNKDKPKKKGFFARLFGL